MLIFQKDKAFLCILTSLFHVKIYDSFSHFSVYGTTIGNNGALHITSSDDVSSSHIHAPGTKTVGRGDEGVGDTGVRGDGVAVSEEGDEITDDVSEFLL